MTYTKIGFQFLEIFAFILPALPSSIWIRLSILTIYLILHMLKVQTIYSKYKASIIQNTPKVDSYNLELAK